MCVDADEGKMFLLSVLIFSTISGCFASIPRPRGVAISMASYYKPGVAFKCLDGSKEVPWDYVNDDYCDCADGTDEPGTAACPGGKFHCTNAGFKPMNILSSRVNDGICDCCDGTDEWSGNIDCVNNCKDLGKKMREEADEARLLQDEGYKTKLQYIEEGKKTRAEKQAELQQLEQSKVALDTVKVEMENKKTEAEGPEKEAKDKHEQAWNDLVEKRKAEKEALRAEIAFTELDTNDDNKLDLGEIKAQTMFDVDTNGEVSDEEAKEHLEGEESADLDHFILKVWPNIKQLYKPPGGEDEAKGDNQPEPIGKDNGRPKFRPGNARASIGNKRRTPSSAETTARLEETFIVEDGDDDDNDDDDDPDDEYEDDDDEEFDAMKLPRKVRRIQALKKKTISKPKDVPAKVAPIPASPVITSDIPKLIIPDQDDEPTEATEGTEDNTTTGEEEEKMPEYDDATKLLIAVAEEARQKFTEAEGKLKDSDSQISSLNSYLNNDYGPDEEYSALKGNCYEFTDREYTYKLCAYDKATQRSKNGGAETTLGNWGHWEGTPDDKYAAQKYDNGQNCWNGPNRSVKVNFKCGLENKVISTSEPSRCEYAFDFTTPAKCAVPKAGSGTDDPHDEL